MANENNLTPAPNTENNDKVMIIALGVAIVGILLFVALALTIPLGK